MNSTSTLGLDDLGTVLRSMAGPRVRVGVRAIDPSWVAQLHPVERDHVRSAVDRRVHEFATGRALLRELLGSTEAIPVGPDRRPLLPAGAVGSLAHDRDVAVAVIAQDPTVQSLGIDVEPAEPLSADVVRMILRDDEEGLDAHLAFTAKEATYKAWSNLGGPFLDHHDVRIELRGSHFTATVVPGDRRFDGSVATVWGRHVALVVCGP